MDLISIKEDTPDSEDIFRYEMKWTIIHEDYLNDIKKKCKEKSNIQFNKTKKYKRFFYLLSIPNIIIPLLLSTMNPIFLNLAYVNITGSAICSILSGLSTFLNLGEKMNKNNEFKNKYNELINDIDMILLKNKKYRPPADITLETIKNKFENTNNLCPI